MIQYSSKIADTTSIFSVMSNLSVEHNAINLGQGFPNFDCDDKLKQLVTKYLNDNKNQYAASAGAIELRKAIADKINLCYNVEVDPILEITITAGATQALFSIINAFVHSGDEVIIIEPAYDSYRPAIELSGGVVVPYALDGPEFRIDWDAIKNLCSHKTKMIIINTPHNPTGKIFSHEDMQSLQGIVSDTNIIVLSDEVYEHLIYDGRHHQSVLRYPRLYEQSICVYSFGKTFHATGWKMGYCVGPEYLMHEVRKHHQWNVFSANSFIQHALAEYLLDPESYMNLSSFYEKKRDYLVDVMGGSRLRPIACEGTYFQLFDYSQVSDLTDIEFAKLMVMDHGVASIPLSPFYSEAKDYKYIRLCFAKNEELLDKAGVLLRNL